MNRLPDSLAEVKGKTLSQTLVDVEGEALVNVLGDTLAGVEFKTHSNTVGEEEAKALLTHETMCISRHYLTCETTC